MKSEKSNYETIKQIIKKNRAIKSLLNKWLGKNLDSGTIEAFYSFSPEISISASIRNDEQNIFLKPMSNVKLAQLQKGETVLILSYGKNWSFIMSFQGKGWVNNDCLEIDEDSLKYLKTTNHLINRGVTPHKTEIELNFIKRSSMS